jgi:arylsulfatase A-like enzyme
MPGRTNVVFLLADQLRAASLPIYGETQIETPNIDRLAREGTVFTNAISTCPVCTPYRSMLVTGRHPQTTGHLMNFVRTRHGEISVGDAFWRAGYRTAWIGKWHLHTGSFPQIQGKDYVPEGRDRLGFEHWRGYNFHSTYFNGWVNRDNWRNETWDGYETHALNRYAFEFMNNAELEPFCLFLSPHQPHGTSTDRYAPQDCYDRLPKELTLPENVPEKMREPSLEMYRHYLAMTLALDDMLGELLDFLERTDRARNTLVVFTSDHGSQVGAHGQPPWKKLRPHEESIHVPLIMRLPGVFEGGQRRDTLTAPVDFFPSLCGLCDVPIPRTVEGHDLSQAWQGVPGAFEQEAVLTMNFTATYDWLLEGAEWRGVRTKTHSYARWLKGHEELYDLRADPLQMKNLANDPDAQSTRETLEAQLKQLMTARNDQLIACTAWSDWFDAQRRIVHNVHGPLGNPEDPPDWSLLS